MNELRIYWQTSVLYSNQTNYFTVGYIDNTGGITDISTSDNLVIIILEPNSYTLTKDVNNSGLDAITVTPSDTNISLVIKLIYNTSPLTNITQVLSYTLVPQINLLNENDIQLLISRVLPPNVYNVGINSTVYPRLYGIANTLVSLYQKTSIEEITTISNFIDSIYPINGDPSWEITLDGTQSLLYQSTQPQYGELLQHIYATTINNDNNPYYYAFNISKFIALLLFNPSDTSRPAQYYVALDENKTNINNSFIIDNNNLDNIILSATNNELQLNINIFPINFLDPNPIFPTPQEQNIINQYIRRITRCAVSPIISYSIIPVDTDLGNTYWGDIRQIGTYCIAYNPGILEQAIGRVLPVIGISEVLKVTFQILIGANWTDFTTTTIPVNQGDTYLLRLTIIPVNPLNPPNVPNPSQYGQFHIGNSGNVSDISVTYNPNSIDNNNYFSIVFNTNLVGNISVNAYGLWFNQVGTFVVTGPPPFANFTSSITSGNVPFSVTFINTTFGIPIVGIIWNWTITGGTQGTDWNFINGSASSQDVVIQFNTGSVGGTPYNVTLNATLGGITFIPKNVIITANPELVVQADFSFLPLLPKTTDTVVFTDTTPTPLPTGFTWSISPATGWNFVTPSTTASRNPSIQFTTATTYQVTNAPTGNAIYTARTKPVPVKLPPPPPTPTVLLTSPNPTTNVPVATPIIITFSEAVTGVNTTSIQFRIQDSFVIAIVISQSGNNYTLTPNGALLYGSTYVVIVNSGITSLATGIAVTPIQFTFTTTSTKND